MVRQTGSRPTIDYCRAWWTTSCPDIAITTDDVANIAQHNMEQQLRGSDHQPVLLFIKQDLCQASRKLCPSWSYKRANWPEFRIKKTMKTTETRRWSNITWVKKWSYWQEPSSVLPKKQFPEEGGETTSQARMHSYRNSIVLSADSERRWNPAWQMIAQLPTTKLKQNLPDRSFNRHVLIGL